MECYYNKYKPVDLDKLDKLCNSKHSYISILPKEIYKEIRKYYEKDKYQVYGEITEEDIVNIGKFIRTGFKIDYLYEIKTKNGSIFMEVDIYRTQFISRNSVTYTNEKTIIGFSNGSIYPFYDYHEIHVYNSDVIVQRVY